MIFFSADEHYGHSLIIKYCNRPFESVEEMDSELIRRFNEVVGKNDLTVHAGDFCWCKKEKEAHIKYISKLNGNHTFLKGSHDHWLPNSTKFMWRKLIEQQFVVVCHYCMRTWERSHYGAWQLFGHSHGRMGPFKDQLDIGVDTFGFRPYSWEDVKRAINNQTVEE